MEQELKYGDVVLMQFNGCSEVEGRFIGYLIGSKEQAVIQYGNPFITQAVTTKFFRKKPETKKRLMTAKELAGKWVRSGGLCGARTILSYSGKKHFKAVTEINTIGDFFIVDTMEYTDTPAEDSSWKSVLVDE